MPRFHRAKDGDKIPISDYNLKSDYLEALVNLKVTGGKFFIDKGGASLDIDAGVTTKIRWAKLLEDLEAAEEDSSDPPPTADAVFLVMSATGEEPLVETEETNPITVINRWTDYSGERDDIILICRVDTDKAMEWTPLPLGVSDDPDNGYPPGTDGCNCGNCFAGVPIPDASGSSKCCTSHLRWSLVNPWLACATTDLTLEYANNADGWLSETFDGPDCDGNHNEYRWQLTLDVEGRSYLTLLLDTDNGCDPVCVIYGRDSFQCQCDNQFFLEKPYGTFIGVDRVDLSCYACLETTTSTSAFSPAPTRCDGTTLESVPPFVVFAVTGATLSNISSPTPCCNTIDVTPLESQGLIAHYVGAAYYEPDDPNFPGYLKAIRYEGTTTIDGQDFFLSVSYDYVGNTVRACNVHGVVSVNGCPLINLYNTQGGVLGSIPTPDPWESHDLFFGDVSCGDGWPLSVPGNITVTGGGSDSGTGVNSPNSDGVCDETCGEPPAPDDPLGSCCIAGACYEAIEEALCGDFGGTFDSDNGCTSLICDGDPHTPCCVAGTCVATDPYTCTTLLGGTVASGGDCDDGVCGVGACCSASDGSCSETTEVDCPSPNYWWGADTDCDPDPCPDLGACCRNPDDEASNLCSGDPECECVLLLPSECSGAWTYGGDGTNCTSAGSCECVGSNCDFL